MNTYEYNEWHDEEMEYDQVFYTDEELDRMEQIHNTFKYMPSLELYMMSESDFR